MIPSVQANQYKTMPFTRKGHIFQKCWDKTLLSFFPLLPVMAVPWRSWCKAEHVASLMFLSTLCGWSHGGPFDYSGIIFWLQFNMALLRESQWNFLFLPCVNVNELITWAKTGIFSVPPWSQEEFSFCFVPFFTSFTSSVDPSQNVLYLISFK